ncbi:ankyrin repeat domain-containing protein 17 isoform 2 [Rattus norvegicus]|uniref:Ankyrin repeat domain-containing protein 17 n=1 Tax=Rattus norvegicus TaxID=10116 RepID=A0A8I6AL58_RAT|nr:ankyrin repeat domain-containing protein 17 isoform 2 [Rattus norvegicus]|eukprot:XP_006250832.1 PREDICTED: ankyrin repeat domain-containing protein 17 isoform X9 [Rattus norvegicus]
MEKATVPAAAEGEGSPPAAAAVAAPPAAAEVGGGARSASSPRGMVRVCDLLLKKKPPQQPHHKAKRNRTCRPPSSSESSSDSDNSGGGGGGGGGGTSSNNSEEEEDDDDEEEEVSEVESFILDQDDLENPMLETASKLLLSGTADGADLRTVDPETQARLEALLEAAGIGKLSTADGKAFADPEVLRRLTSSVSCALDEAAAALTRMRAESTANAGQSDNRSLAEACSEGDVNAVRKLLIEGRSVNEHTEEGESLLCLACSAGYYELAQVLLAMHANVEDRGIKGDITPLMAAANGGHVKIVKLLLAHKADVNAQSSTGNTALTYACAGGYVDVVKVLLESGASIEDHNENGHTPLMEAGSAGHVEVARLLLENGAGINTHSNEFKESALTLACYKGHLEMVRFLLEAGADQEHKTDEMHTALMEACMDGHVEVARLLLDSGAQVNMPADSFESPLTLAACGGHVELAALLIERGASLEEVNDEGYTPLMEAAREGHEEMVALLLGQGANINAQTEETQETALTLACCGGFLEVADFLIKAGADIELGCSTPLMEAAQEGHLELVKYLLAAGANVHATTATGDTALTYACENGHTDVADVLLQAGADLEHESEGGRTPLMKAARAGHVCTVQFLISKGANVNRTTANNDHTVLSLACAGGHLAVVELLLAHGADPTHRLKDGSTMLIEAAKGGHTSVVCYLLDYPNNLLAAPPPDVTQLTPPSHDLNRAPRVPVQALPMVVPPQEPDKPPANVAATLPVRNKAVSGRASAMSNTPTHSIAASVSQPQTPTPSPIISPSAMLPIYPAIDIDAQTESNHDTALTLACAGGHEELVQTLLERGASIEHRDKKGFTPLILAATAGHVGVVEILLDNGADIEAQSERTKDTPLSLACSGGRQEVVELLLARGANKEHRNVSDYTPLSLAASGGYVNIIKILLNAGAEINSRTGSKLGISPLMLAAMNGHTAAVKLLLDMGSDINAQIETNRNTALTLACFQGRTEVVSLLLDRKANVEHRAKTGLTPLMEAASGGYAEVGRVLLDKGADVNAPPVPSSRDTALTIAADKGHYKFCELLIGRGAHIDVRNKKGNTPLWLAANGGHLDVVQLLVQAGADVDAADNRKITPLMAAFRKGHVKVVRYLVKEVNQFPSDSECMRYIATITDKEMLKKCHLCMESIVQAKDRQAAEANKNASILLEELDLEKLREESRRLALAAKREKRKEKRRKKKEEQRRKLEEIEAKNKENFELQAAQEKEKHKVEEEPEVLTEPPSATTTTTIGISATWTTLAGSHGKRNNTITTTSSKRKNRKNKITPENVQIIFDDPLPISYSQPEKASGESKSSSTSESGDSDNMRISSCSDESSNSNSSRKSDNHSPAVATATVASKKQPSVLVTFPKEERKSVSGKASIKLSETVNEGTSNSLSTCTKSGPSPLSSPNGKLTVASPKRGPKREEGWKEVVRRSKKVSVPSTVISRVIGRGGCNINAIREFTGAHIDIDKQKDKTGDRIITIRGGTESTRQATQLINALIKDPDKEIDELIPKNRLKSSSANSKIGSSAPTTTAANSSLMGIKMTSVALSSTSQTATALTVPAVSSASTHKTIKNPVNNVRPGFPVSLPLAYPPPQFAHALLAAQTFQQIRPPRLPMTHFGGTFPPAQSTWGPFPVRPLSPARATNSPKPHMVPRHSNQNSSGSQVNSAGSLTSSPTTTTSSSASAVPGTTSNGSPSSPSVRRQLFVTVVKTSNATTTTVTTTASNNSTAPTNATYPMPTAKEHYPVSSPSSPSPPAQPGGVSRNSPLDCGSASPNKGASSSEQEASSPPVVETTNSRPSHSSTSSGSSSGHSTQQQPPGSVPQEPRPPLQQSQVPSPDVRMTVPPTATSSAPVVVPSTAPMTYPMPQTQMGCSQPPKMETPAIRPPSHGTTAPHKNSAPVQNSSVAVLNVNHIKRPHSVPSSVQLPSTLSTQSACQNSVHPANKPVAPNFSAPLPFGPFSTLFENNPTNAHAFWGGPVVSSQSTPESMLSGKSSYLPNSDPLHQSDTSKAPGFRPPLQRPAPSPSGIVNMDTPYGSVTPSSTHLGNFASSLSGGQMYGPGAPLGGAPIGGAPLGGAPAAANFNRQHFSPLSLLTPCSSASNESPAQSVSSGVRAPSPAPSSVPLGSEKPSSVSQDRKVPVPIGTERSARIRQTGTSAPSVIGSNLSTSVGHSGIWSFEGIGGNQDKVDWCNPGMGNPMIHRPMSDPGVFSQHQAMERDSTGIVTPSGTFHQHVPAGYMDFPKLGSMPFSVYGNAMLPPVAPIPDGAGGPIFNGPHSADPSWNSLIKMVSSSTENNGPQTVWTGPWAPHMNSVHMNQLG